MRGHLTRLSAFLWFVTLAAGVGLCDPPLLPQASEVAPPSSGLKEMLKDLDPVTADAVKLAMSIFDDFDGRLTLDWQLLRPAPTHFSLAKHPGNLTISTQRGTIHLKRNLPKAKPSVEHDMSKKIWLRLTLRKDEYDYASSTDGEDWTVHGALPWGDGPPKRIGLLAKNGGVRAADSVDACFEFFEIRSLTQEHQE